MRSSASMHRIWSSPWLMSWLPSVSVTAWLSMARMAVMKFRRLRRRRSVNLRRNRFRRMKSGRKISTCPGLRAMNCAAACRSITRPLPVPSSMDTRAGPDGSPPQRRRRPLRRRQRPQSLCRHPQGGPPHRQRPGPAEARRLPRPEPAPGTGGKVKLIADREPEDMV